MGKHSVEQKGINKKVLLVLVLIIIIGLGSFFAYKYKDSIFRSSGEEKTYTIRPKTKEGEKLVLKSNADKGRYIEFFFENDKVTKIKIFEQFEDEAKYEERKEEYSSYDIYKITKKNNKKLILEVEKTDLEEDEGLSYEEVYDKYVNKIVGAYEVKE